MTNRIDRRRFLLGSGGAMVALPMLEHFMPRTAYAQTIAPPKRLVIFASLNGRMVGNGKVANGMLQDWWSPGTTTGPLPPTGTAPSQMLAPLAAIRDEIVTVDGIDDIVRHASGDPDGHQTPTLTSFTCRLALPLSVDQVPSPSIDYIAGLALRANSSMRPSIMIPASATPEGTDFTELRFWGAGGSRATNVSGNPQMAITDIFGPPPDMSPTPMAPTLAQRLQSSRKSILDGVLSSMTSLRTRLNSADRDRLDAHATFIRNVENQMAGNGTGVSASTSCTRPDPTQVPHVVPSTWDELQAIGGRTSDFERGNQDNVTVPYQIENLVMALACDVTRCVVMPMQPDPTFLYAFPSGTPFSESDSFHQTIHGCDVIVDQNQTMANNVHTGHLQYSTFFTQLIQRLAQIQDIDGSRLLDNTLVLWSSELGYGSEHTVFNIPTVFAGMRSAFPKGQGRHVVENRRTRGDVYAHILRMLGGSDMTFGETGTLGALASKWGVSDLQPSYGAPGYINANTPLHAGPLDL